MPFRENSGDILDECLTHIQVFAAVWRIYGHDKNWPEENSCTSLFASPRPLYIEKRSETTNVASPNLQPSNFRFGKSQDLVSCNEKFTGRCVSAHIQASVTFSRSHLHLQRSLDSRLLESAAKFQPGL